MGSRDACQDAARSGVEIRKVQGDKGSVAGLVRAPKWLGGGVGLCLYQTHSSSWASTIFSEALLCSPHHSLPSSFPFSILLYYSPPFPCSSTSQPSFLYSPFPLTFSSFSLSPAGSVPPPSQGHTHTHTQSNYLILPPNPVVSNQGSEGNRTCKTCPERSHVPSLHL